MEYVICGTGVLTLTRNWPQPGSLVFSIDTCDNTFTTSGGMHLPIATNPQHTAYVNTVVFEATLECDNGQTINKKICFNPQTMSKISCNKPLPTSPNIHKKLQESDEEPRLPKLNPQLGDKSYLKKLITSMNSVDEFTSWFDKTYGPYREAGS